MKHIDNDGDTDMTFTAINPVTAGHVGYGFEHYASISYVENEGTICPLCGSGILEGDGENGFNTEMTLTVTCLECDTEWEDVYLLTHLEEITEVDETAKPLPREMSEKYIASKAKCCPHCSGKDLRSGATEGGCASYSEPMNCLSCGKEWADVFTLSHIRFPK